MKIKYGLVAAFAMTVSGSLAMAQPPQGGPGGPGGHGGPGGPPPNPIMEALDPDHNHELSKDEIDNATSVLRSLDKNGDGILNEEDLGRMGPPEGGRSQGGPGGGPRGGGPRGGGEGSDRGARTDDFASRLAAFDKNENGSIEKDELPERMQKVMARLDTNKDDVIDADELKKMKDSASQGGGNARGERGQRGGRRGGGEGEAGGRRGGGEGEAGGRRGRGGRGGAEGGPGGRGGPEGGMRQDRGGGPDSARFVEHAMTFDADGDGSLSRDELAKFAAEMGSPRGQGGPGMGGPGMGGPQRGPGMGGPPRGQRGGGQRGGGGNQQRRRPN